MQVLEHPENLSVVVSLFTNGVILQEHRLIELSMIGLHYCLLGEFKDETCSYMYIKL